MTKEKGYWRTTVFAPGLPPRTVWYDKEENARLDAACTPKYMRLFREPEIVFDTEFDPADFEKDDDKDADYYSENYY